MALGVNFSQEEICKSNDYNDIENDNLQKCGATLKYGEGARSDKRRIRYCNKRS